jgi:hypothetical protein
MNGICCAARSCRDLDQEDPDMLARPAGATAARQRTRQRLVVRRPRALQHQVGSQRGGDLLPSRATDTNIIENMMGTVRRVTRNVKRWSSPSMALRWTAAAMHEAKKGFRRLKAFKQLLTLRAALAAHYEKETNHHAVAQKAKAA